MAWGNRPTDYNYGVPRITTYAQAKRHFDKQQPWKNTDLRPAGKRTLHNRVMRQYDDGSIGLIYFGDELVRYHLDGTISVAACTQQRQGSFPERVVPFGIKQDIGTRCGPIVYLEAARPNHVRYDPKRTYKTDPDDWNYWNARHLDGQRHGDRDLNPEMWVVRARRLVHVRRDSRGYWRPVDVDALKPFEWQSLDRSKAREAARAARIPDFVATMDAIAALNHEAIPPFEGVSGYRGRGNEQNYGRALSFIKQGNFYGAMALLRRDTSSVKDHNGHWVAGPERIMSTELERIRTTLYLREGALTRHTKPHVTLPEYVGIEAAMKRFKQPKID